MTAVLARAQTELAIEADTSPTEDIYFRTSMVQTNPRGQRWERLAPGCYRERGRGGPIIVLRRVPPETVKELLSANACIHYVLDDDILAGMADSNLPLAYRLRLGRLWMQVVRPLCRMGATVHVPSRQLARRMAGLARKVSVVAPCYTVAPKLQSVRTADRPPHIAYLGTRSHTSGLSVIAEEIGRWMDRHPDAILTTFLGHRAPAILQRSGARHRSFSAWRTYKEFLREEQVDVVLSPGLRTAFNAARSHNRLLECAALGAVPIVSRYLPAARFVRSHGLGLVAKDGHSWASSIDQALMDPSPAKRLQSFALDRGSPERQRAYWNEQLASH